MPARIQAAFEGFVGLAGFFGPLKRVVQHIWTKTAQPGLQLGCLKALGRKVTQTV